MSRDGFLFGGMDDDQGQGGPAFLNTPGMFPPPSVMPDEDKRRHHEQVVQAVDESDGAGSEERAEVCAEMNEAADRFIYKIGVGARFHSSDCTNWLDRQGLLPPRDVWDPRGMGAIMRRLTREGKIRSVGYTPNGGSGDSKTRNYHSLARPLYEVVRVEGSEQ